MKRKLLAIVIFLVLLLQTGVGAVDIEDAAPPEPEAAATELGLKLSDLPETVSPEQAQSMGLVERLRDEELDPNTAVFRNAGGTNTLFIFSEDIWHYNEQGEKTDYSTRLVPSDQGEAAYRTAESAGVSVFPAALGESSPVRYSENGVSISLYPTLDRIDLPETEIMGKPSVREYPLADDAADAADADAEPAPIDPAAPETDAPADAQPDAATGSEPAAQATPETVTKAEPDIEAEPEVETEVEVEVEAEPEPEAEVKPEAEAADDVIFADSELSGAVSAKKIIRISDPAQMRAIADANAQASLASGKLVNRATLTDANDAAAPQRRAVEYFRANRDASIVATPLLHGVKNEIILESAGGAGAYSFIVQLDGLVPTESTGDAITLLDADGAPAAFINVEPLHDAAGNLSCANTIDIAPYGGGRYIITVTPDRAFLSDPGTVYPVTASVNSQTFGASYINDTEVRTNSASTNYNTTSTLWAGNINSIKYRGYIQFILGSYKDTIAPNGITDAYLNLYEGSTNTSTFTLQPRIPDNIWTYTTLTWNNQPGALGSFNGISAPANLTLTTPKTFYRLPVTAFVQGCMRNYLDDSVSKTIHEKRGLMLKLYNESNAQVRMFNSTNASTNKPSLVVTYISNYYGTAGPYWSLKNNTKVNCAAYAVGKTSYVDLTVSTGSGTGTVITPEQCIERLTKRFQSLSITAVHSTAGQDARITEDKYRIAVRVNRRTGDEGLLFDYHVIVQNKNGSWSGKMGSNDSMQLKLLNVMTNTNPDYWSTVANANSATIDTYFFLVSGSYKTYTG